MVAIDMWPQQGAANAPALIVPGFDIGFCYLPDGGVTEGYGVTLHGVTSTAGYLSVVVSNALGDAVGVVLKTGVQYDYVPVCFYGLMKLDTTSAVTVGQFVIGASGGASVVAATGPITGYMLVGGASYSLGLAMQTAATSGDEILVLVGKCI